jgi:hypothetical protein
LVTRLANVHVSRQNRSNDYDNSHASAILKCSYRTVSGEAQLTKEGCVVSPGLQFNRWHMGVKKELLEKSVENLLDKAEDCRDLAETQHDIANKQHDSAARQLDNAGKLAASADALDALGRELEADAVEIKGEMEMVAARTSPALRERSESDPMKVISSIRRTISK